MSVEQAVVVNRILARLQPADFALVANGLEPVKLPLGQVLAEAGSNLDHIYFLDEGIASIVVKSPEGQACEAGIIGREGYVWPLALLGSAIAAHHLEMQMQGAGHRIARSDLLRFADASATLRSVLLSFACVLSIQIGYSVLSNAVHTVDERLARWLLMCHDRSDSDDLALTHRFMSVMLAVRRPSVTSTLHVLEGLGFISTSRGYVTIRDRPGLETFARDAYGKPEADYRRLLGPL